MRLQHTVVAAVFAPLATLRNFRPFAIPNRSHRRETLNRTPEHGVWCRISRKGQAFRARGG